MLAYFRSIPLDLLTGTPTMRSVSSLVLSCTVFCTLPVRVAADEPSIDRPTDSIDSMTAPEVLQHWSDAMDEFRRVDLEFVSYTYDLVFEHTTVAKGRLVRESGSRQFMSIEPCELDATIRTPRLKKSGAPFSVRRAISERFIAGRDGIWWIDDDGRDGVFIPYASDPPAEKPPVPARSVFDVFSLIIRMNNSSRFTTIGEIVCSVHNRESKFSMRDSYLEKRFETSITITTAECVGLSLVPRFQQDGASFSKIEVLLSRETWLPDAVKLHDPAGTKEVVFIILKRRINDCAESVEYLFHPDLTNYSIGENHGMTASNPIRRNESDRE